jgi:hypothetical protein
MDTNLKETNIELLGLRRPPLGRWPRELAAALSVAINFPRRRSFIVIASFAKRAIRIKLH